MTTTETPLSDLIDRLENTGYKQYIQFVQEFRRSTLGVIAEGPPEGFTGDFTSTAEKPIAVGSTVDAEGRSVVLAFADPPAFALRFGPQFNATISGEKLLETVLINPDSHGILVNSAKKEVSAVIGRATIERLVAGSRTAAKPRAPWWKFW